MAISIKSMNALAAIKKIGVPQKLYDWLVQQPIQVSLSATKFTFTVPTEAGAKHFYVTVTLNQLQQLSAGTLPADVKLALQGLLAYTIEDIKQEFDGKLSATQLPAKPAQESGLLNKLPPLKVTSSHQHEDTSKEAWPKFNIAELKTASPVKLRDATMMYQPVHGTSPGSRYFVVAANKDLRVAARYTSNGKLSVRIEGPSWQKYAANITDCGFTNVDSKKDYASVHLDVGHDMVMANKTLGALLLGLGVPLDTPVPELKVIKE